MKSYRTVKYINGLLPMQYVFLIRSRAGCKKYVTRLSRVTYFLQPARERIKNLCSQLLYDALQLTICHAYFVECALPRQSPIANRVLHTN